MPKQLRVLELFAGIGGCAAAIGSRAEIVAAVDTDPAARVVYEHNFAHPFCAEPIESLSSQWFQEQAADVWWMSPPTSPYAYAGLSRELDDPRSKAILNVIEQLARVKPKYVVLECVNEFNKSRTRQMLHEALTDAGYEWQETRLCPTELGIPNKRPRYYLVAGRAELRPWQPPKTNRQFTIASKLDQDSPDELRIAPELLAMHRGTMDLIDPSDLSAVTSSFTADYGRSVNKTGSYVQTSDRVRYFSPIEILRQLGFPVSFTLPSGIDRATAWRLIGNSSSVPATRMILDAIPGLFTQDIRSLRTSQTVPQAARNSSR